MKQIDLEPHGYRKQDPRSGKWLHNVDKRFCRVYSLVGAALLVAAATHAFISGQTSVALGLAAGGLFGFAIGGLFTMSLRNLDW